MLYDHRNQPIDSNRPSARIGRRGLPGGRLSRDKSSESLASNFSITAPTSPDEQWRLQELDSRTLSRTSATRLMELLPDLSPEVSRALWDFLRFCNPGWELTAYQPGTEEVHTQGQEALEAFQAKLVEYHGTVDHLWNTQFLAGFLRGGFFAELVLNEAGTEPLDIATPDPASARFRKALDPVRGSYWQLGQHQDGNWVSLDRPTIRYIPIDPLPGKAPYGRPLAAPALFTSLFLLMLLHDLRRVVAQQGYPRIDVEINRENLEAWMPDSLEMDPDETENWVDKIIDQFEDAYANLEPDDTYFHLDAVKINRPVGTVDSSSLGAIDGLIRGLERMATRGLKSMPLLMGSNEAVGETHANRQWEIHVAGIKSIQHPVETLYGALFTLALQCQGIQAVAELQFSELRASEELRDAQTESMKIRNAREKYAAGWISQDEAAQEGADVEQADVPEPRDETIAPAGTSVEGIQGDNRGLTQATLLSMKSDMISSRTSRRNQRVNITPEGADEALPEVPEEVTVTDTDIEQALLAWNAAMPDYEDLLSAAVEGQTDFDDEMAAVIRGFWTWQQPRKRYKHGESQEILSGRLLTATRDIYTDAQMAIADGLTQRLVSGDITVQQWELEFRKRLKTSYFNQFALPKGGRNNLTTAHKGIVEELVQRQYQYLHRFAEQIATGDLSTSQISRRSRMYFHGGTQAYERGKAASYGLPTLPEYPADGSQRCLTNCRCSWRIEEDEDGWDCYWDINADAENCTSCQENTAKWNPLRISKAQARTRGEVVALLRPTMEVHRRHAHEGADEGHVHDAHVAD